MKSLVSQSYCNIYTRFIWQLFLVLLVPCLEVNAFLKADMFCGTICVA